MTTIQLMFAPKLKLLYTNSIDYYYYRKRYLIT